jgi:hypothetical protein
MIRAGLEGASSSDTVDDRFFEGTQSLRHMEPEHLSSLPREGHVPSPQEESSPRSGSTFYSLGLTRAAGGVTSGVGAERRHRGRDSLRSLGSYPLLAAGRGKVRGTSYCPQAYPAFLFGGEELEALRPQA